MRNLISDIYWDLFLFYLVFLLHKNFAFCNGLTVNGFDIVCFFSVSFPAI